MRPFIGVDGEGGNISLDASGFATHQYLLLRAGQHYITNPTGLSFAKCADFLASLDSRYLYVSFFFDYDVTMMCRSLPPNIIGQLLNRQARTRRLPDGYERIEPVRFGPYEFDYLPKKHFKIRRLQVGSGVQGWTHISDTGTFFQCAFVTALERWNIGTPEVRQRIAADKANRSSFGELTPETIEYNGLECRYLAEMMEKFRAVCVDSGYVPALWEGPGNMATAMFHAHGIPPTEDITTVPEETWRYAQAAYYGGRFETTAVGTVQGLVTQYDINSAYPYAATQLPCLIHGGWKRAYYQPHSSIGVFRTTFTHHPAKEGGLYNLPIRLPDGSITYPRSGEGWYWSQELDAATDNGTHLVYPRKGWQYVKNCDCQPFNFIPDVYRERLKLGKSGKGLVLKLALNSLYGKLAQSVGQAPMANPIWSGMITAITRAKLVEAYGQAPESCIMLATDGLFFTGYGPPLPTGKGLGEWEKTIHSDGAFIIQPGLYFVSSEMGKPKTRGVPQREVRDRLGEFQSTWESYIRPDGLRNLSVPVPMTSFIGLRLAYARDKLETAGSWVPVEKDVSFAWHPKRNKEILLFDGNAHRTFPVEGGVRTTPYSRMIGGNLVREMERLQFDENPEYEDEFTSWD